MTRQAKMSRLRHVHIYAMQVTSNVRDTWYRTTCRQKLIVPEISRKIWNYFPMRSGPAKHLSDLLTFIEANVDDSSGEMASATRISAVDEIDPSSDDFPGWSSAPRGSKKNAHRVRTCLESQNSYNVKVQKKPARPNVGIQVRREFFVNGPNWTHWVFPRRCSVRKCYKRIWLYVWR